MRFVFLFSVKPVQSLLLFLICLSFDVPTYVKENRRRVAFTVNKLKLLCKKLILDLQCSKDFSDDEPTCILRSLFLHAIWTSASWSHLILIQIYYPYMSIYMVKKILILYTLPWIINIFFWFTKIWRQAIYIYDTHREI